MNDFDAWLVVGGALGLPGVALPAHAPNASRVAGGRVKVARRKSPCLCNLTPSARRQRELLRPRARGASTPAPASVGGAIPGIERARPWSDVEQGNADFEQFGADVARAFQSWRRPLSPEREKFARSWSALFGSWRAWFAVAAAGDHHSFLQATMGEQLAQFEAFERELGQRVRQWASMGETTSVTPPDPRSPLEQALSRAGSALPWIGAAVVLVLVAPTVLSLVATYATKKAALAAVAA